MAERLTFEPSIFRDWTVMFCSIVHKVFTQGFEEELGWHYSDVMFAWDGEKVTIYRAIEEHVHGFFNAVEDHIKKSPDFLIQVADRVVKEVLETKPFWESLADGDLSTLSNKELLAKFKELDCSSQTIIPWFLILMYFPQQLELLGINKYDKYLDKVLEARGKVDKILAPLSNRATLKLSAEALRRSNINDEYARYLSPQEFHKLLSYPSVPYISDLKLQLKERIPYCMVAGDGVSVETPTDYTERHGWGLEIPDHSAAITEIKGRSAFIAKSISGTVKIVPNQRQLHKIKSGDILVAPMTTPEYGPVFHLIKAIVTDEGGITCHAAIISREMKIPAIVGTKIASKVLKDGDKVEVDTKNGIVRILNG